MTKFTLISALLSFILFTAGCKKTESTSIGFNQLTQDYYREGNDLSPINATFNNEPGYNDKMTLEMTAEYRQQVKNYYARYEQRLNDIDKSTLSNDQQISYDIIKWDLETGIEMLKYPTNMLPINHFNSGHLLLPMLASGESIQPFKTEKDYHDFLKRLDRYAIWLDSAKVCMTRGIAKGYVLPKALTLKMIPQFDEMITENAEENMFYAAIKVMPKTFSDDVKNDLSQKYAYQINKKIIPRLKGMSEFLKNDYLKASRTTSGFGDLPNGKQLYATLVKINTTTNLTPDEIHSIGLKEVARITKEIEKVKAKVGFKGSMKDFFVDVRTKKELMPFTSPEQVIANYKAIYERIKPNVDKLFELQPKSKFEIRRTESFREKTSSAEYLTGTADGSRPGVFYVPIPDVTKYNMFADENTFVHEAIPGHHFQLSLQIENKELPDFRRYGGYNAYSEGWALYCESLGEELGVYTDPYQYLGMLSWEIHRAIRLVVDTGIHSKGWTREQAIEYSLEHEAESEAKIVSEIERYMAQPGQALSYKIGQMKIIELRKKAQEKLGSRFDIRKFHAQVLESGCMPLALLEKKINQWIDGN